MFGPGLITCAQYAPKMMHTNNTHGNGCDYYKMADFDFISKDGMLLKFYDPFSMAHSIWLISHGPFDMVHFTWSI